jgi:hypothetical protein
MLSKDGISVLLVRSHDLANSGDVGYDTTIYGLVIDNEDILLGTHCCSRCLQAIRNGLACNTPWAITIPQLDSLLSTKVVLLLKPTMIRRTKHQTLIQGHKNDAARRQLTCNLVTVIPP